MNDPEPASCRGWLVHALDLAVLDITGRDRARFLHSFCTAEVQQRSPGETCEAMILDGRGKLVGLVQLVFLEDAIRLLTVSGQAETLRTHLDRYVIREDVRFEDRSTRFRHDFVFLPIGNNLAVPQRLPPDGRWMANEPDASLVISSRFAGPGWLVQTRQRKDPKGERWADGHQPSVLSTNQLRHHGQPDGEHKENGQEESLTLPRGQPEKESCADRPGGSWVTAEGLVGGAERSSFNELQLHRIRAGSPWFGVDCDGETLPQELRRDALAISFTKGCYLGQETVARIDALGHVNKWLVVLRSIDAKGEIARGGVLTSADREVGRLSSVALDSEGRVWGLATVRRREATAGCQFQCDGRAFEVVGPERAEQE